MLYNSLLHGCDLNTDLPTWYRSMTQQADISITVTVLTSTHNIQFTTIPELKKYARLTILYILQGYNIFL